MHAVLNKIAKGMTVCYAELFPNKDNEYLHFHYEGRLFLIADSYCMNPTCTCQEAALNFVQAYPKEKKRPERFQVILKRNGKGVKIHDYGSFSKHEIKSIVSEFTAGGLITELLNERYKEMRHKAKEILR